MAETHAEKYAAAILAFELAHFEFECAVAEQAVSWADVCAVFDAQEAAMKKLSTRRHGRNVRKVEIRRKRRKAEVAE